MASYHPESFLGLFTIKMICKVFGIYCIILLVLCQPTDLPMHIRMVKVEIFASLALLMWFRVNLSEKLASTIMYSLEPYILR